MFIYLVEEDEDISLSIRKKTRLYIHRDSITRAIIYIYASIYIYIYMYVYIHLSICMCVLDMSIHSRKGLLAGVDFFRGIFFV